MNIQSHRIALVTYALRCGGVSAFLFRLGRHLQRRGWAVDLITTEEEGDWFDLAGRYGLRARHVSGIESRTRVEHSVVVGSALVEGNYNAVLLNHTPHAQMSIGMLPDSTIVVPILHGDDEPIYEVAGRNRQAWNIMVAPSPKLHAVAQLRVPDRPVVMIPHGVAIPVDEALQIEKRAAEPLKLAFVGRLDESHKGLSLLPKILTGCIDRGAEPKLRIAGAGQDGARLKEWLADAGLDGSVEFMGTLQPTDTYRLLLDSHALLFPSTREGSGFVPLEAQACGCVPICSALRGVTDATVEHKRTGFLLPPGDAGAFADAVVDLNLDRPRWKKVAEAAHKAASDGFRMETMGEKYRSLLLEGFKGHYPLRSSRHWRRPLDLESLLGDGFILEGIRRMARWWRSRSRS